MDFRQMQYLVTLADEEQFTRAASVCGVSQSGLSAADPRARGRTRHDAVRPHDPPGRADRGGTRPAPPRPHDARSGRGRARRRGARDPRAVRQSPGRRRTVPRDRRRRVPARSGSPALPAGRPGLHPGRLTRARQPASGTVASTSPSSRPRIISARVSRVELGRRPMILLAAPDHPLARVEIASAGPTWATWTSSTSRSRGRSAP